MIRFACPGCAATFTVGDDKAGKTGKCPKCNTQFTIPDVADAGSADAAPPEPPPLPGNDAAPPPLPSQAPPPPPLPSEAPAPPPPVDPNQPVEVAPCPSCQTRLSVMVADLGLDVECPTCKTIFKAVRSEAPLPPSTGRTSGSALEKLGAGADEDEEDRPRKKKRSRRDDDDDDDDRPSRRRSRRDDDDDDDYGREMKRPGAYTAIAVMMLVGGIIGCLYSLGIVAGTYCMCLLWPGTYLELVSGILAIIKGSQMLGKKVQREPSKTVPILMILCILNLDITNCVLGIICLVLFNNDEVKDYMRNRGRR